VCGVIAGIFLVYSSPRDLLPRTEWHAAQHGSRSPPIHTPTSDFQELYVAILNIAILRPLTSEEHESLNMKENTGLQQLVREQDDGTKGKLLQIGVTH
jgi:hypothetical protein